MLAYGLDLFSTRLSPSRSFDVLSPTFNKLQLLVTVTGLSGALVVTRSMVSTSWQSERDLKDLTRSCLLVGPSGTAEAEMVYDIAARFLTSYCNNHMTTNIRTDPATLNALA